MKPSDHFRYGLPIIVGGLAIFAIGFVSLADSQEGSRLFGWLCATLGILVVTAAWLALDSVMKASYPKVRGLIELSIGMAICVINLSEVTKVTPVAFYGVLSAGVVACGKGLKDIWEGF